MEFLKDRNGIALMLLDKIGYIEVIVYQEDGNVKTAKLIRFNDNSMWVLKRKIETGEVDANFILRRF
jgi:hypothetical protein